MASKKSIIAENIQYYLERSDWKAAIREMEKLFAIDQDPLVRVRIGDAWLKLDRKREAIRDYVHAADLFAEKGFVVKALAQYKLALRLDSSNDDARTKIKKMQHLRTFDLVTKPQRGIREYHMPQPIEAILQ
jgi:tetratricopeptide (TPR) repeat protein